MRTYGQYCPIARGSEVLAERWTTIIMRNILLGHRSFNAIERGAPGISRTLLSQRLGQLVRVGLLERQDGSYVPTPAGDALRPVLDAIGTWGARWLDVAPAHLDPYLALWSMTDAIDRGAIPARRIAIRFEFPDQPRARRRFWLLLDPASVEICLKPPAPADDLVVVADSASFVRWHMGTLTWREAKRAIRIEGDRELARAFPTWSRRSSFANVKPAPGVRT